MKKSVKHGLIGCGGCGCAVVLSPFILIIAITIAGYIFGFFGSVKTSNFQVIKNDIYTISQLAIKEHKAKLFIDPPHMATYELPEEYKHLSHTGDVFVESYVLDGKLECIVKFSISTSVIETEYYIYHYEPKKQWQNLRASNENYTSCFLDEHVEYITWYH